MTKKTIPTVSTIEEAVGHYVAKVDGLPDAVFLNGDALADLQKRYASDKSHLSEEEFFNLIMAGEILEAPGSEGNGRLVQDFAQVAKAFTAPILLLEKFEAEHEGHSIKIIVEPSLSDPLRETIRLLLIEKGASR